MSEYITKQKIQGNLNLSAAFTGHRSIQESSIPKVEAAIEKTIALLVKRGVTTFYNGGSYGFDLLSAEKVIVLKIQRNLPIKLIMVLPCKGHDVKWNDDNKARLLNVLNNADETICLSERYYDGCMKARNNYLIEHSDICVAYMTYGRSGSSQTVRLAREKGLEVINLAEN